jgi:Arc/MetJ-type ribon-helix-helix transcriptional regulator
MPAALVRSERSEAAEEHSRANLFAVATSWLFRVTSDIVGRTLNLKGGPEMNLEIHKPELAKRVRAQIQSGHFQDADDLLEKALDALDEQSTAASPPATATGAVLLAALQASPYREIDLTPPRVPLTNVRDVAL